MKGRWMEPVAETSVKGQWKETQKRTETETKGKRGVYMLKSAKGCGLTVSGEV